MNFRIQINRQPAHHLVKPIAALNSDITSLDLSDNHLGIKDTDEIAQALAGIPAWVTSLSLRWNRLARKSSDELVQILSAIPDTVINLSLRGNLLHNRKNGFLAVVLAAIPKGVRFLDLSLHNFSEMNANELAQGFAALPPNVTSLNLGLTNLERLSVDSLRQLKNSLPHIRTIYLGYNEISAMSPAQRCALKEIFPNVKQIIFLDSKGKEELAGRDLRTNANLARGLEFNTKVPSLADQCAFFTKNSTGITDLSSLPLEMQERVNSF